MKDFHVYIQIKSQLKNNVFTHNTYFLPLYTAFKQFHVFFLFLPSFIFFLVFAYIYFITEGVKKETQASLLPPQQFAQFSPAAYPILEMNGTDPLLAKIRLQSILSAQGAIVVDNDSSVVLFSKNPTTQYSMASTTKIMTALVALEQFKLDDVLTVHSTSVPPAVVGYSQGEKVQFLDMLYGMFLPSGNDAALAIAQNYPGGEGAFVTRMNEKAKELSLTSTHFSDSSGLDNGNYTTVLELAKLASVALKNPVIKKIVGTKEIVTTNFDGTKKYTISNINQLLGKYGVNGVKTGFTPDAGGILVTSSLDNGHMILYVVMKSEDRFADTEKMLQAVFGRVTYISFIP